MSKGKSDSELIWKVGKKEKILDTPVFTVNKSQNQAPNGHTGTYVSIDAQDWAAVIPVAGDDFLMVRQWRHAYQGLSLEFPGGVVDAGETPEQGASRELLEETGCKAGTLVHLGTMSPNPALFSNRFHVFLAKDLTVSCGQKLDADEFLNFVRVPQKEVFEKMGGPECPHALMVAALELFRQHMIHLSHEQNL